jgi:hypothetical protein
MRTILRTAIGITLLLGLYATNAVFGQTPPICQIVGDRIVCTIKENSTDIIGPVEVPNASKVVIKVIEKSPFDECSLGEIKLTEIKEPDAISAILQILAKASGFSIPTGGAKYTTTTAEALPASANKDLRLELLDWRKALQDRNDSMETKINVAGDLARRVDALFNSPPRTVGDYNTAVLGLETALKDVIGDGEPSLESEQLRYPLVKERLKVLITPGIVDPILAAAAAELNNVAGLIAALKANAEALIAARAQMRVILAYLKQIANAAANGNPFQQEFALLGYTQKAAETSISCTNTFTKKVTFAKLPVTILYKNDPAFSVSAGILLSTTAKQKLGIVPQKTGVDANGVPTFKNVFGVVDHARVQIAPFSFLNYRLFYFGKRSNRLAKPKYSFNLSAGIGVNPNSGSNEVEYFFGPAIGIKNYMIQFGDHIGRFQNGLNGGFVLGDTVPANFPSTLPINKVYKHGFGIAISYRLPL